MPISNLGPTRERQISTLTNHTGSPFLLPALQLPVPRACIQGTSRAFPFSTIKLSYSSACLRVSAKCKWGPLTHDSSSESASFAGLLWMIIIYIHNSEVTQKDFLINTLHDLDSAYSEWVDHLRVQSPEGPCNSPEGSRLEKPDWEMVVSAWL